VSPADVTALLLWLELQQRQGKWATRQGGETPVQLPIP
jgi:hypothetical protein